MMLDTALLKRPAGLNGSPGGKEAHRLDTFWKADVADMSFFCTHCAPPFSFSISSCRCRTSSQILRSAVLLPRPKLRKVDKAKRRCLFHISPLLMNRPPRHKHAEEIGLTVQGELISTQHETKDRERFAHLSFLSKICQWLHCMVGPQSSRLVSRWLPSPSCTQMQSPIFHRRAGCWTHSHRRQLAVNNTSRHNDEPQHIIVSYEPFGQKQIHYEEQMGFLVCRVLSGHNFYLQFDHQMSVSAISF